jgi:Na+/H+ antiporter NhaD/arsenite permease-like protein
VRGLETLPVASALPFAGLLLSIALLPVAAPALWHRHYPKITAAWTGVFVLPFVVARGRQAVRALVHVALLDYLPFVVLLAALYTIAGGIRLRGTLHGRPAVNAALLATGTLLASWVGTTGAAMLLVRPLLRANRARRHRAHTVVFFIALVANVGGALTPLGDPPLFLGFLHGVPFAWTLGLWPETLLVGGCLLAAYLGHELYFWRREDPALREPPPGPREPLGLEGAHNLVLLAVVLAAVVASGAVGAAGAHEAMGVVRDGILVAALVVSWLTTSRAVREANGYSWAPMREVAILFAGIFATMIPALAMLRAGEAGPLAWLVGTVRTPAHFFWATGTLSSVLDNAPTYLTFLSTALGRLHPGVEEREAVLRLIGEHDVYLRAIAVGAVFMGANTYVANAPNFMVKAIAEEAGVRMPSFFGYVLRYALPIFVPIFALATWVFFGG